MVPASSLTAVWSVPLTEKNGRVPTARLPVSPAYIKGFLATVLTGCGWGAGLRPRRRRLQGHQRCCRV
ncbi:hypothetical protein SSAG_00894 [Streptomyces sp. Mg1]|nr:hypothetical protein SSAG_00894 [Streptomyces sp. Mg1]